MTESDAERFDKALAEAWANNPDRSSNGAAFFDAACETYMQQHQLFWGYKLSGFDPDDMKMLGRWLARCVKQRDSDLNRVTSMLTRSGITHEQTDANRWDQQHEPNAATVIQVRESGGDHNHGYSGFATLVYFDAAGHLLGMGAWE